MYCFFLILKQYECKMVLYFPERINAEAESISDRGLMDDEVEIIRQKDSA